MLTAYVVCGSRKEAERISVALVEERLAACVNFFPCRSVFKWKGRLQKTGEWILLAKTTEKKYPALERRVRLLHSASVPAIFAWKDSCAEKKYAAWVARSCF